MAANPQYPNFDTGMAMNAALANTLATLNKNNSTVDALSQKAMQQLNGGMKRDILSGLLGAGVGALAGRYDDNVGVGGGALFGALAGGLLSNKLRRTNVQNAVTNIGTLQGQNNDLLTQLVNQAKLGGTADAVNELAMIKGLGRPSKPIYNENVLTQLGNVTPTDAVTGVMDLINSGRSTAFGQGMGVAGASTAAAGLPVVSGAGGTGQPAPVATGQYQPGQVLQGGVAETVTPPDPRLSMMPPAIDNAVLSSIFNNYRGAGDTGLGEGVKGARVPSQNRQDDASAYKQTQEGKYVPYEAQSKRISAEAQATSASAAVSNAAANNKRADFYGQQVQNNGQFLKQTQQTLSSIDQAENSLVTELNSKGVSAERKAVIQTTLAGLNAQRELVKRAIWSGQPLPPETLQGAAMFGDFGG